MSGDGGRDGKIAFPAKADVVIVGGGIEVATTPERWEELHRRHGRAMSYGLASALLTPDEVHRHVPVIDPSRILGGFHVPSDGIAKATRATAAMAREAADAGMRAFGHCAVTGFEVRGGAVRAVETTLGTIQ